MSTQTPTLPLRLLLWIVVQWFALLLGASGVSLSIKQPSPAESLAAYEMLVVQFGASALLFPFLMPTWKHSLVMIACAIPFALAAGWLAAVPTLALLAAIGQLVIWLVALAIVAPVAQSPRPRSLAVAIASLTSVGGAMLMYFRLESNASIPASRMGPLVSSLLTLHDGASLSLFWSAIGCVICAMIARVLMCH